MTFASSFLTVVLVSPFILLLLTVSSTQGHAYEGDTCTVNNGPGICKNIQQCPSVYDEFLKGNPPLAVCGFVGDQHFVCCPTSVQPSIDTTTPNTTTDTGSVKPRVNGTAVSKLKCEEYSKVAYEIVPTSSEHPEYGNVSICPFGWRDFPSISGGVDAKPKEFPHMAAIGYDSPNGVIFSCGGSLISERYVLSAAHCCVSVDWGAASWVRVGDVNLERTDDNAQPQQVKIIERIKHPDYKRPAMYHDIALLKLESPVTFDAWVRPLCLPYSDPDTGGVKVATATGWGLVAPGEDNGSAVLQKVTIGLIENDRCNRSIHDNRAIPLGVVDNWQICAGEPNKDTCQGDSGGPLVIRNQDYNCTYSILGITSFGGLCGSATPGVYTRVSHYVPWIEKNVWPEAVGRE